MDRRLFGLFFFRPGFFIRCSTARRSCATDITRPRRFELTLALREKGITSLRVVFLSLHFEYYRLVGGEVDHVREDLVL